MSGRAPAAHSLGGQLIERLLATARALGYQRMVLDTLEDMIAAQTLYRSLGFRETEPYYFNPMAGVTYMEPRNSPRIAHEHSSSGFRFACLIVLWAGARSD